MRAYVKDGGTDFFFIMTNSFLLEWRDAQKRKSAQSRDDQGMFSSRVKLCTLTFAGANVDVTLHSFQSITRRST